MRSWQGCVIGLAWTAGTQLLPLVFVNRNRKLETVALTSTVIW